jgi:hypothetical protein
MALLARILAEFPSGWYIHHTWLCIANRPQKPQGSFLEPASKKSLGAVGLGTCWLTIYRIITPHLLQCHLGRRIPDVRLVIYFHRRLDLPIEKAEKKKQEKNCMYWWNRGRAGNNQDRYLSTTWRRRRAGARDACLSNCRMYFWSFGVVAGMMGVGGGGGDGAFHPIFLRSRAIRN